MEPIGVVDDDDAIRTLLRAVLREEGYTPYVFDGMEGTLARIRAVSPAAVILDLQRDQATVGAALLNGILTDPALERAALIVCANDETALSAHEAALHGRRYAVLPTPFTLDELMTLLTRLLQAPTGKPIPTHLTRTPP